MATLDLFASALVFASIGAGSTALFLRLRPRVIGSELFVPLAVLFLSIALASTARAFQHVAELQGALGVAGALSRISYGASALEIPAFVHLVSRFPRNLDSRTASRVVAATYGTAGAILFILPTPAGVVSDTVAEGHVHLEFGGLWSALTTIQAVILIGLIVWLVYLSLKGRNHDEMSSARGLLVAGGVPTVAGLAVVIAGLDLPPPLDPATLGVAWWVAVIFLVVGTGRLEFRILPPMPNDAATLGERPRVSEGRLTRSPLRRNMFWTAVALGTFLLWMVFLNAILIGPSDAFGRSVYNQVSIIVYSVALTMLAFRLGAKEANLARSARSTLESMPLGLAVLSPSYRVEFANRALLDSFGFGPNDLIGRRVDHLLTPEDAERVTRDHPNRALGQSTTYKLRIRTKEGGTRDSIVVLLPYAREGYFDGVLAVVNDISEMVELRREAEHLSSLASFLSDAVTHDLSNALQVALVRIQLASQLAAAPGEKMLKVLGDAEASTQRSVRLIKEVKQIAIAERDRWPRSYLRFTEILEEAVASTGLEGSARLRIDLAGDVLSARVNANGLLATALAKVIEEAAETAASADSQVVTRGRTSDGAAWLRIEVVGSARPYATEDFEMLSKGPSGYQWGDTPWRCGVRIALAAAVLRAHGGTLTASSGPGHRGTMYTAQLPLGSRGPVSYGEPAPAPPSAT